jgi:hypothetical protein
MSVSAWCTSELTVSGPPARLAAFAEAVAALDPDEDAAAFAFERISPVPTSFDGDVHSGCCCARPAGSPIDEDCWRTQNWGCLTDAEDVEQDGSPDGGWLRYRFATGDEPPIPLVMALGGRHPELAFELVYVEVSAILAGRLRRPHGAWGQHARSVGHAAAGHAILGPTRLAGELDGVHEAGSGPDRRP